MTEPKRSRWHLDNDAKWQIGGTVALAVLIVGCMWFSNRGSDPPDGFDAQVACKSFVEDRLKSPSSADFSNVTHSGDSPRWTVTGSVDAENSFGASLRSDWTCTVRLDGGDFVLESLTGLR